MPAASKCTDRMRVTSWYFSSHAQVSEACFLFEMLLFISCCRYSILVRAWWMCVHKRTVSWWHSLVSFFTFLRCFACCHKAIGAIPARAGEKREKGETRWEAGCWGADTAALYCCPDFIYQTRARMDHRPAGRPTCCSCPGNTQQWSTGIYRHQLNLSPFLPPPLWFLTLPLL